jgi:hypothetical protein
MPEVQHVHQEAMPVGDVARALDVPILAEITRVASASSASSSLHALRLSVPCTGGAWAPARAPLPPRVRSAVLTAERGDAPRHSERLQKSRRSTVPPPSTPIRNARHHGTLDRRREPR